MGLMNIGVSGMTAQSERLTTIANNIANSSTTAYKAQDVSFSELILSVGSTAANGTVLQSGNGVEVSSTTTDWTVGSVDVTNDECDFMISGDGFVAVSLNGEIYYTRDCDFSLVENPDTTVGGYVLMNDDGAVLIGYTIDATTGELCATDADNYIVFLDSSDPATAPTSITINSDGSITAEPSSTMQVVSNADTTTSYGQIGVQRFNNPDSLIQSSGGLYRTTTATSYSTTYASIPGEDGTGTLTQGALEESNVDLATEFTDMIIAQRSFQGNSKVITVADDLLQTVMGLIR